jgi:hypothetical protein
MMQSGKETEELTKDAPASPRMLRFPVRHEQHPHPTQALVVGTPEHAALVAAVKENFPEIYEAN